MGIEYLFDDVLGFVDDYRFRMEVVSKVERALEKGISFDPCPACGSDRITLTRKWRCECSVCGYEPYRWGFYDLYKRIKTFEDLVNVWNEREDCEYQVAAYEVRNHLHELSDERLMKILALDMDPSPLCWYTNSILNEILRRTGNHPEIVGLIDRALDLDDSMYDIFLDIPGDEPQACPICGSESPVILEPKGVDLSWTVVCPYHDSSEEPHFSGCGNNRSGCIKNWNDPCHRRAQLAYHEIRSIEDLPEERMIRCFDSFDYVSPTVNLYFASNVLKELLRREGRYDVISLVPP